MKKALLTMMVLAASTLAWAQEENKETVAPAGDDVVGTFTFIPKVGLCYSTVSMNSWPDMDLGLDKPDISGVVGPVVGLEAEYRMQPWLGLSAALFYSMQGRKYDNSDAYTNAIKNNSGLTNRSRKVTERYHFLNVPVTANFHVMPRLSLYTGLQLGILFFKSQSSEWLEEDGSWTKVSERFSGSKVDFSIPVGASYALDNGLQFDLRYNHGLSNLSWSNGAVKEKSRVVQLTVGYRLDMSKIIKRKNR